MIRAYCCSALDTLHAYIQAEIFWDPIWGHEIWGFGPNGAFRAFGHNKKAQCQVKMCGNHEANMFRPIGSSLDQIRPPKVVWGPLRPPKGSPGAKMSPSGGPRSTVEVPEGPEHMKWMSPTQLDQRHGRFSTSFVLKNDSSPNLSS